MFTVDFYAVVFKAKAHLAQLIKIKKVVNTDKEVWVSRVLSEKISCLLTCALRCRYHCFVFF